MCDLHRFLDGNPWPVCYGMARPGAMDKGASGGMDPLTRSDLATLKTQGRKKSPEKDIFEPLSRIQRCLFIHGVFKTNFIYT